MVTDRYQHLYHHSTVNDVLQWANDHDLYGIAVIMCPARCPLRRLELLERGASSCLAREGPG